ncbi:GTPase-activating protein gyp7 [Thelephora terrestris]|uniref:GTPase-activating protein gyp7 n=1 Tax=Thelephora terrestris TaxID=56493 RepID=A0A9P6LC56_9AGAM|nr:GTPase-activating protein gyp7 [Thelephora terrestris]
MVEIKRQTKEDLATSHHEDTDGNKYRLLYTKSKVYVNPTAYSRDNIPGFVAIVKREAVNPDYLLAWIPESLLDEKGRSEWDKFVSVEGKAPYDEEEDAVLIDMPTSRPETYAFSVPLTSVYSLLVYPPNLSSWYGSIAINLINGSTLPTLYFHDDESTSFCLSPRSPAPKATSPATYPPQSTSPQEPQTSWGGEDLIARLRNYSHVLRSSLDPALFLVDPSRADVEAHTTILFGDDEVDDILAQSSYANSFSPIPAHRRPRPIPTTSPNPYSSRSSVLHRSMAAPPPAMSQGTSQARMALLQSFSNIKRATQHAAQNILSHPLAKPIVPHLPDPVKSLVNANGEWEFRSWVEKGGVGEFESARVYLARWARVVAEEGERARRREAQVIPSSDEDAGEESSSLGIFELLHNTSNLPTPKTTRTPKHPVDTEMWMSWFDSTGRPKVSKEEMRREVFRRGISSVGDLRRTVWPLLLGVLEWDTTTEGREKLWEEKRKRYYELRDEWCGVPEVFERQDVLEERHRIDVDCRRTDRAVSLFAQPPTSPDDKTASARYAIVSPQNDEIGAQAPSNEHTEQLAAILLTYGFYERELGYVQGMSDLCAPIYVVMGGEPEMTFWCLVEVMDRMKQNFLRDQSGMKKQLSTLQQLIAVMDPELYRHFEKAEALNLFFCFRWVLIAFKREFSFNEVLRLWEVLWTDYYSNQFLLFVAFAVLESHRDMILRYLIEFDEILKYCNELSMTIELDTTLAQAEVLFLSFSQLVADIDRRRAEGEPIQLPTGGLRNRKEGQEGRDPDSTRGSSSLPAAVLPTLSEELRELLKARR